VVAAVSSGDGAAGGRRTRSFASTPSKEARQSQENRCNRACPESVEGLLDRELALLYFLLVIFMLLVTVTLLSNGSDSPIWLRITLVILAFALPQLWCKGIEIGREAKKRKR
jgi:hypothetical protein